MGFNDTENADKSQGSSQEQTPEQKPADAKSLDEMAEAYCEQIDKIFDDHTSAQMGEVAINDIAGMKNRQKKELGEIIARHKADFERSAQLQKEKGVAGSAIIQQAEDESAAFVRNTDLIFKIVVKGEHMTLEEAVKLQKVLGGVEKISKEDQGTQRILDRINNETLGPEDYQKVISIMNPQDLISRDTTPEKAYDAATAGMLISLMNPKQHKELIEQMMVSPKSADTAAALDAFLGSGALTQLQGQALLQEAMQKNVISQQQFQEITSKMENGTYLRQSEQIKAAIEKEVERMQGMYANNIVERVAGRPLLGVGMTIHSIIWFLTNILSTGGDLKSLASNPYIALAVAEGAAGVELANTKRGTPAFGYGAVSRGWERLTSKEEKENTPEGRAIRVLSDIYSNNIYFGNYLSEGGYQILKNLKDQKAQSADSQPITVELLMAEEEKRKLPGYEVRLSHLTDAKNRLPEKTAESIPAVADIGQILALENQKDFNDRIAEIRREQGLEAPGSAPAQNNFADRPAMPEKGPTVG